MSLLTKLKALRKRRHWARMHAEWLRTFVACDDRWLAGDAVASALTERYRKAIAENWYELQHEDISDFRRRIGLDPHGAKPMGSHPINPGQELPAEAWRIEQQHPTRPEVSKFYSFNRRQADEYKELGWTVTPLAPKAQP